MTTAMTTAPRGRKPAATKRPGAPALGKLVDALYEKREAAREAMRVAEALKSEAYRLETEIIAKFDKTQLSGAAGRVAQLTTRLVTEPTIEDISALVKYMAKTGHYALLQKRPGATAIRELWEDNKVVPGIGTFDRLKVSLTKLKTQ